MHACLFLAGLLVAAPARGGDHHLYWGTLHEHTSLSRSQYEVEPEAAFQFMIETGLDFGALTDYDWALSSGGWDDARRAVNRMHCPAGATGCYDHVERMPGYESLAALGDRRFVSLLAYEWNNNAPTPDDVDTPEWGHRNVFYLLGDDPEAQYDTGNCDPDGGCLPVVVSGQGRGDSEEEWAEFLPVCTLWEALAALEEIDALQGFRGFAVPHHPALSVTGWDGEDMPDGRRKPTSTDWSFHPSLCPALLDHPDPDRLQPLVEIYSGWGNNEHGAMEPWEDPVDGLADPRRVVREAALGGTTGVRHRLGFIGSGEGHWGRPGEDPHNSFLLQPDGRFRNRTSSCAPDAACDQRFSHVGLLAVRVPAQGTREDDLTREAVFDALASRHTVATTGERFVLEYDLVVDGEARGIQGDILDALDLADAGDAALEIRVDLGAYTVAALEVVSQGDGGDWNVAVVMEAAGDTTWTGEVPLVQDGVPVEWLPQGDVLLYARVVAEPVGAIRVAEGARPLEVRDATGGVAALAPAPGHYTAAALAAVLEEDLAAGDLEATWSVTWDEAEAYRFAFASDRGESGLQLGTSTAPELAEMLGFRDDQDTPTDTSRYCDPCIGSVDVEGGELTEMAWASPVWFRVEGSPGRRCGCGSSAAGGGFALVGAALALAARRRRAVVRAP